MNFWTDTSWLDNTRAWLEPLDLRTYIVRPEYHTAAYVLLTSIGAPLSGRRKTTSDLLIGRMVYDQQGSLKRFILPPDASVFSPTDVEFYVANSTQSSDFLIVLPDIPRLCTLYVFRYTSPMLRQDFHNIVPELETQCYSPNAPEKA